MKLKKLIFVLLIILLCNSVYAFKINIPYGPKNEDGKHEKNFVLFAMIDSGFSILGVNDGIGVTDYQSYFFRTGVTIWKFSIAFDINIRFRIFTTQPEFKTDDWYVAGDPAMTAFAYLDKIDHIRFGGADYPFYFTTGMLPYTTFGSGMLVNNFNNNSFSPIDKENCLYFKFNGEKLGEFGVKNIPVEFTFFTPDILDPDIFAFNANLEVFKFFKKLRRRFSLNVGLSLAMDFDANESNRLSSVDRNVFTSHRNIQTQGYTSSVIGFSVPISFSWTYKRTLQLWFSDEPAFLWKSSLNDAKTVDFASTTFSFGNYAEIESRIIYIKNSGFMLGLKLGFITTNNDYNVSQFSSNYQIARKKQFVNNNTDYSLILLVGMGLYALNNNISFKLRAYFDMNHIVVDTKDQVSSYCYVKFDTMFSLANVVVKGLGIDFSFETAMSQLWARDSNGGNFIRGLTRDCRLYFDICYQIYSAKIKLIIGIQSPAWNNESEYVDASNKTQFIFDLDKYAADFQKFVGVEVSFVL